MQKDTNNINKLNVYLKHRKTNDIKHKNSQFNGFTFTLKHSHQLHFLQAYLTKQT